MKKIVISVLAVATLLLTNSFLWPDMPKEEVRKLDAFSGIGISVHADVFYTPGNTHEIKIEGDENDVDELITEVEDGYLKIRYPSGKWRVKRSKLTIHVTSRELEAVKMSGSGLFDCKQDIASDEMELDSGNADEMDLRISGSGKLLAEDFEVNEFSAAISGSGSARITAKEDLDVKISGSGKVYYHGDPRVNSVSSGSGKAVAL